MRIKVITPLTAGGPHNLGKNLARILNRQGIDADWKHSPIQLATTPFWQTADLVQSVAVPLFFALWNKPIVFSVHGEFAREDNPWRRFFPRAIERASVLTTPSLFLKERLKLKDALVIPNAVFSGDYPVAPLEAKQAVNLLTVTRFDFPDKAKGVVEIVDSIRQLPDDLRKRVAYRVVGGGPYLSQVIRQAGRTDFPVEFVGFATDVRGFLVAADVFVYCSHLDNFPMVILEAMASGLPVLTNNVGAVNEIITHEKDGFIEGAGLPYRTRLESLIADRDLRAQIAKEALQTARMRFDWDKIILSYKDIYCRLI